MPLLLLLFSRPKRATLATWTLNRYYVQQRAAFESFEAVSLSSLATPMFVRLSRLRGGQWPQTAAVCLHFVAQGLIPFDSDSTHHLWAAHLSRRLTLSVSFLQVPFCSAIACTLGHLTALLPYCVHH
jgi:hypothetical protein